ncbi:excalibur calcium-binding domain-containing protein [Frankia sp. AiPa1]|nr:excalibur calcium-binding domain-containing protein [Frankia sp. AiPa1]
MLVTGLVAGCGPASDDSAVGSAVDSGQIRIPDVLGLHLDEAKTRLGTDVVVKSVDGTGRGRMQIVDGNWHVIQQEPTAGSTVPKGTTVTLNVVKEGEAAATASPAATAPATAVASFAPPAAKVAVQAAPQTVPAAQAPPAVHAPPTTQVPLRTVTSQPASAPLLADPPPPANSAPPAQGGTSSAYYANCTAARAAGVAPLHSGQPGYRAGLDRDGDGIACET